MKPLPLRQRVINGYNRRVGRPRGLRAARTTVRQLPSAPAAGTSLLVFSKDRPLQLHALLDSAAAMLTGVHSLTVLYAASDRRYLQAYDQVVERHAAPRLEFLPQARSASFRGVLREMLASVPTDTLAFLVDDIICLRPCDLGDLAALADARTVASLRLGRNCVFSYAHSRPVSLPASLARRDDDLWQWRYGDGDADWGYPLSLDGHLFLTAELRALAASLLFSAPNTLEVALQVYRRDFAGRTGICHDHSRLVSLPYNRVQVEVDNLHGTVGAAWFLQQWEQGLELDWRAMSASEVHGAHQELPLLLRKRVA